MALIMYSAWLPLLLAVKTQSDLPVTKISQVWSVFLEEAWTQFREHEAAWDRVEQVLLGAGGRSVGS